MKERPILFSAPMIRALLAGTKTQTRQVVKDWQHFQPHHDSWRCPYGTVGTKLWVRETFCDDWKDARGVQYRADGGLDGDMMDAGCRWRPAIHMPRWASRITLEVTGVRVERLQDISIEDCKAEGAWTDESIVEKCEKYFGVDAFSVNPRLAYRMLWESINGAGSWDANPFVWVVEFRRITP